MDGERVIDGDGVPLFVRELGSGRGVVVVHGGPDFDQEYLRPELDRLAASWRVVCYDQRGRGRSFDGTQPAASIATEVADLERVRVACGLDPMAVVGHSWGGLVALEHALAHPARVSHLVLMNTGPVSHAGAAVLGRELVQRRTPDERARMAALRCSPGFAAGDLATNAAYYRIHYRSTVREPALLDALIGRLRRSSSPAGVQVARAIEAELLAATWANTDYDLVPQLGRIDVPTLAIHGDDDLVPLPVVERIVGAIPGAELIVVSGTGHFSYLERPYEVIATITEFLDR